ncbi:hypothetical protein NBC122_01625 [Chryseobacterium salivictor]|uniref:Uncharacterized protein n=1 Tax=Chryseobacterium salivictor TaxID=2547600 RepID=A0A4P6ZFM7_9FLAO|nr:hypothetical protein NBC122_01625 [Chryseobacterium salivictor]
MFEPINLSNRLSIFSVFESNIKHNRLVTYSWQLENFPTFTSAQRSLFNDYFLRINFKMIR